MVSFEYKRLSNDSRLPVILLCCAGDAGDAAERPRRRREHLHRLAPRHRARPRPSFRNPANGASPRQIQRCPRGQYLLAPAALVLSQIQGIKGWTEAMQLMKEGDEGEPVFPLEQLRPMYHQMGMPR